MAYTPPTVTGLGSLSDLTLDRINKTGRKRDNQFEAPLAGVVTIIPS